MSTRALTGLFTVKGLKKKKKRSSILKYRFKKGSLRSITPSKTLVKNFPDDRTTGNGKDER